MEVPGASIVAESPPALAHPIGWRGRQILESRVPLQETRIELDGARDLGLLEHELRNQNRIGVANTATRKPSAVTSGHGNHPAPKSASPSRFLFLHGEGTPPNTLRLGPC